MRSTNFQSPFLERSQELGALQDSLDAACNGMATFVAIAAEAGAGKSRLVEELLRRNPKDVQFLCGRAFLATATTPYAVWVDALEPHLRSLRRRDLLHVLGDSADLRRLFPGVDGQFPLADDPIRSGEVGLEQTRLFGQMAVLITRLAELNPVALVLDNLQWADRSSIELLHAVVRGVQGRRVLIVGLMRTEEAAQGSALRACIDSLAALDLGKSVHLGPLTQDAVAAIVLHAVGTRWADKDIHQLHLITQGNALFIWEYIKHALAKNGGRPFPQHLPGDTVPSSIGSLIAERLRELDDDARQLLAISAVIEASIAYPLLQAVTGFTEERLLNALDKLTALRFLNEIVDGRDVLYEFHKPLVQATVHKTLGAARRQYLNRRIASELMRTDGERPDPTRIARHLVAGAAQGRQEAALPYLLEAANRAVALFGNHEAIDLLTTALRVIASSSNPTPAARFDIHANLGESYKRLGQFENAVEVWSAALSYADDRQRAALRRSIARALWQAGRELDALGHLQKGIEDLGSAHATQEGACLRQEYALGQVRQGNIGVALHEAAAVLDSTDETEHPEVVARAYVVLCLAHGYRGDIRGAMRAGEKAVSLSSALAYPGAAFLAHYTMAALLRYEGDLEAFEAHCEHCIRIAGQMHAVALESWPLSIRIERYTLLGRFRDAISIGERAVEIDKSIRQGTILPRSLAFLAVAYRLAGDASASSRSMAEAERLIDGLAKTEMRSVAVVAGASAYLNVLDGKYTAALEKIEGLVTAIDRHEPLPFYLLHPYVLPLAAEAAIRMGYTEKAKSLLSRIKGLETGPFRPAEGAVLHVSGLLELLNGTVARAQAALAKAIAHWDQHKRPFDSARARVDLADAHDAVGDSEAAVTELTKAGKAFSAMDATKEAAMVSQRLRKKGVRPAFEATRRPLGMPVSARELDIVRLVATGRTNREMAAELFLSELTIETHVKNILRKLGLKSRAQIATYAAQLNSASAQNNKVVQLESRRQQ